MHLSALLLILCFFNFICKNSILLFYFAFLQVLNAIDFKNIVKNISSFLNCPHHLLIFINGGLYLLNRWFTEGWNLKRYKRVHDNSSYSFCWSWQPSISVPEINNSPLYKYLPTYIFFFTQMLVSHSLCLRDLLFLAHKDLILSFYWLLKMLLSGCTIIYVP